RIQSHLAFVQTREQAGKPLKHRNVHYGFPVVTRQETALFFEEIVSIKESDTHRLEVEYAAGKTEEVRTTKAPAPVEGVESKPKRRPMQRTLFSE
ncbi:MAG: site-specific DNA-methyltransferase, partial [Deltaproteobacteria bacterium]|nr:site-specific DNA-methyltransferase [Deltaproteobacteria bacterium]